MLNFLICEINGKQIKVLPNKPFEVTSKNGEDVLAKTLIIVEGDKVKLGKPYLKDQLKFKILEQKRGKKLRIFKYHAKANYRRARGFRPKISKVVLEG